MNLDQEFWDFLEQLVATSQVVIDRPGGAAHPRYPDMIYPVNYGFLEGTTTVDGAGIDVWVGSLDPVRVNGILCTVDLMKRDVEVKLLLGCTEEEIDKILDVLNSQWFRAILVRRPD